MKWLYSREDVGGINSTIPISLTSNLVYATVATVGYTYNILTYFGYYSSPYKFYYTHFFSCKIFTFRMKDLYFILLKDTVYI